MKRVLLATLLASGCSTAVDTTSDPGASQAITAGQIVAGDSPYYWANLTFEQHLAALAAAGSPPTNLSQFTADDDPLAARLQSWATKLEGAMRSTTKNTAAPSPIVKLLTSAHTMNAWSSGTFARLGAPVGDGTSLLPDGQVDYLASTTGGTTIQPIQISLDAFVHPAAWTRLQSFTQVWDLNPLGDGSCRLKSSQGRVVPTGTCPTLAQSSTDALVPATSPFLTVATDLVAALPDERAIVFVMAHELGHLFRAHTSPLTVRKYDFWYDQGPTSATRPVAAADAAELAAEYQLIQRTATGLDGITTATLPPSLRLFPLAAAYYTELVQAQQPTIATPGLAGCAGYADWVATYGAPSALFNTALTTQAVSEPLSTAYLALEPIVSACDAAVHIVSNSTETDGIDWTYISTALFPVGGMYPLPATPAAPEGVAAFLKRALPAATQLLGDEEAFRTKMNANRIGLYTIEQEADEVGAELMMRLGFTAADVLAAWVGVGYALDGISPPGPAIDSGRADTATCAAWMQNDFQATNSDGTKTPVVMTIGDITEPHHGDCYRLYNLWRETGSHHYGSNTPPLSPAPAWSDLVTHATELTQQAAALGE